MLTATSMKPKYETRCFWFDDDGKAIRSSGCPNGRTCSFAHPTDDIWDNLPVQLNRPAGYERDTRRRGGHSSRRDSSRRDSPPRSRYRSRSRSRSRRRRHSRSPVRSKRRVVDRDSIAASSPEKKDGVASTTTTTKTTSVPTIASVHNRAKSASILVDNNTAISSVPTPQASSSSTTTANLGKKFMGKTPPDGPSALRAKPQGLTISTKPSPHSGVLQQVLGLRAASATSPLADRPSTTPVSVPTPAQPQAPPPPPSKPPPEAPTPMPPPYPLPEVPEGLTLKVTVPTVEPSPAEKRKIWEERIKHLADAYQSKRDLEHYEQMHKTALDISQSHLFASFTEEDKAKYNADLASVLSNLEKAKNKHEEALEKLVEQGSWPLGPPPLDEQSEQERREILRHVQELNETAQKMSRILGEIAMQTKPPVLPLPLDDEDDFYVDDEMDLDGNGAGTSKDVDASGSVPSRKGRLPEVAATPKPDPDLPTREELERCRDRIEDLKAKMIDLENHVTQFKDDSNETFSHELEKKIETYDAMRRLREKERRAEEKKNREAEMGKVKADAEDLGKDVDEIGKEVAEALGKIETLKLQLVEERKERDDVQSKVTQVNDRFQSYLEQRDANLTKIQTLETALKAYQASVSQIPAPAPVEQPIAPTSAYILSQLEEPIMEVIRQYIQPMLAQSRIDTETLVRERNMEIVKKVWPRMELVSKLLANVADRLDKENVRLGKAAAATMTAGTPPPPPPTFAASIPVHPMPVSIPQIQQRQAPQIVYPVNGPPPWFGRG